MYIVSVDDRRDFFGIVPRIVSKRVLCTMVIVCQRALCGVFGGAEYAEQAFSLGILSRF